MNKFYKVSLDQYCNDTLGETSYTDYEDLKLPRRSTKLSAGYDFFAPIDISILPGHSTVIPTGIRIELDEDKFLMLIPRSGLGFKYHLTLSNTLGVIDADYFHANNEGHIMAKLINEGNRPVNIEKGAAFMQGIILQYFKTDDDYADGERTGGLGSTDR